MAASGDSWVREYNEAVKLVDDITHMISERSSLPETGPEAQRHASAIRRKITILGTRLDSLQSLTSKLSAKQSLSSLPETGPEAQRHASAIRRKITILGTRLDSLQSLTSKLSAKQSLPQKELNRRNDMAANLRSKANQMASTLNMSNFANRDSLLGPEIKPADAMSRANGLDNQGIVGLQRQVMREQDDDLEKLEESVVSTKHIALAVGEELDLHTRLIDNLDEHVEVTDSKLQRVQKRLAILNKRTKGGCSCLCLMLAVLGIVVLVAVIYMLIKYL